MKKEFSLYLDLVRLFAALLVLLYHSANIYNPGGFLFNLGHEAVVIFFVLSGFVIAFVADTKEKNLREYSASRASRLYSVALPAVFITFFLDHIGISFNPDAYDMGKRALDYPLIRIISSLTFINQYWVSIQMFSNVPYWSLSYEAWYYISFAVLTYLHGQKKWVLMTILTILAGPKILLLMPIWWVGVLIYRSKRLYLSNLMAACLLFVSSIGFFLYIYFGIHHLGSNVLEQQIGTDAIRQLASSRYVLSDYILALLVASHFISIRSLAPILFKWLPRFTRPIRYFSSFTFSIYLFHQPLLLFFNSFLTNVEIDTHKYALIMTCTIIAIWVIGHFTEYTRPFYKRAALKVLEPERWSRFSFINAIFNSSTKKLP